MTDHAVIMLNRIYGNQPQKDYFSSEAAKGTLAHAYIIEGADGSGKYMMANAVCALLAANEREAMLTDDGQATDIVTVEAEENKKQIGINLIRSIRQDAYIKPNDFDFKAYIVKGADRMTVQAQNAILKLLEEPPASVYFFLLCESASALLPTVRSRAPVIRMQVFDDSEIADYILKWDRRAAELKNSDPEAFDYVIRSGKGTIGGALEQLEQGADGADIKDLIISLLDSASERKRARIFLAVNALPLKREELLPVIEALQEAVRDMIYIKHTKKTGSICFGSPEKLVGISKKLTSSELLALYAELEHAGSDLTLNMNAQNVRISLATGILKCLA